MALGLYIIKTKPRLSFIIFALSVAIFYSSAIAISQFILQHSIGGIFWFLGERTFNISTPGIARAELCDLAHASCRLLLRAYGTFPHPNVLGGYLAITLPLIIYQSINLQIYKSEKLKKIWYSLTLVIGSIALVLTFSRSALLIGATGMIFAVWQKSNFRKILFCLGLVAALVFVWQIKNLSLSDESIVVRQQLNLAAFKLWQESPVFGVGLGNFLVKLPEALPFRAVYFLQPVHNIYLLILAESGVVGLASFFWLISKSLGIAITDKRKAINKTKSNFYTGLLIPYRMSLIAFLFLGLVDHYPLDLQQGQLLLTLLLSLSLIR